MFGGCCDYFWVLIACLWVWLCWYCRFDLSVGFLCVLIVWFNCGLRVLMCICLLFVVRLSYWFDFVFFGGYLLYYMFAVITLIVYLILYVPCMIIFRCVVAVRIDFGCLTFSTLVLIVWGLLFTACVSCVDGLLYICLLLVFNSISLHWFFVLVLILIVRLRVLFIRRVCCVLGEGCVCNACYCYYLLVCLLFYYLVVTLLLFWLMFSLGWAVLTITVFVWLFETGWRALCWLCLWF